MVYCIEINTEDDVSLLKIKEALSEIQGNFSVSYLSKTEQLIRVSEIDTTIDGVIETINGFKITNLSKIEWMLKDIGYQPYPLDDVARDNWIWTKDRKFVKLNKKIYAEYEDGDNTYIYYLEKVENI